MSKAARITSVAIALVPLALAAAVLIWIPQKAPSMLVLYGAGLSFMNLLYLSLQRELKEGKQKEYPFGTQATQGMRKR